MEHLTTFVSSRGILKSCASHHRQPASSQSQIEPDFARGHRPHGTIYVCTDALTRFAQEVLPTLEGAFSLVSGDSDVPISATLIEQPAIQSLLASELLVGWHAQNLAVRHPKISHLPIGLDYHTMWERPGLWGITAISPMAQENALVNALAMSPEFNQRYFAAYCNWHFAMGRGDRQECFDKIDRSLCLFEGNAVPRNSSWMRQAEFMFVVSPEGAGMDCHRTWEALLLGCIPIMKKNALANLFADLPVLLVDDWSEVRRERLLSYVQGVGAKDFDFSSLFRHHWVCKVEGRTAPPMARMSFAAFRSLLTRKTG